MKHSAFIKITIKVVVSLGFMYFVFSKLHVETLVTEFTRINIGLFALATALYLSTQVISTKRWAYFVRADKGFGELFVLYMIGTFFNLFMPGTVGGDAVKAYYLYKGTQKKGDSLVSVFMERYMGMCGLMFIALAGVFFGYDYVAGTFIMPLFWALLGAFAGASLAVVYFPYELIYSKLKGVRLSIGSYLRTPKIVANTFFLSLVVQGIGLVVVYLLGLSLGLQVNMKVYLIFIPIISVISMIPVSFSGAGVREYSFMYLFGVVGVSKEKAVTLSLLWFVVMIITGLVGMIFYLRRKH